MYLGTPPYSWTVKGEGDRVTFTALEKQSEDIIKLEDATGKVKTLRIVIKKGKLNMVDLIAGADGKVDEAEMGNALGDFFDPEKQGWIDRTDLFLVVEGFLESE
ncbi:hypothetical protein [Candidatus Marithrix sp. Canyon 246]|uniref:hypothetical protein n=1 Tax=Candidatus Marithrix sp. Canyon 246 TaxID=1827136 RepID=UPI00084A0F6B|nr:hypothetical protein [Candidatus Marithrix sp. Canyon 246]